MICLCGFALLNVFTLNAQYNNVILQGSLMTPGPMRSLPIEAYQSSNGIELIFNANLGSLNIVVVDELGSIVFQTTFNATNGSSLTIDTEEWKSGEYSLQICNGKNECAEGSFVIVGDDEE